MTGSQWLLITLAQLRMMCLNPTICILLAIASRTYPSIAEELIYSTYIRDGDLALIEDRKRLGKLEL